MTSFPSFPKWRNLREGSVEGVEVVCVLYQMRQFALKITSKSAIFREDTNKKKMGGGLASLHPWWPDHNRIFFCVCLPLASDQKEKKSILKSSNSEMMPKKNVLMYTALQKCFFYAASVHSVFGGERGEDHR